MDQSVWDGWYIVDGRRRSSSRGLNVGGHLKSLHMYGNRLHANTSAERRRMTVKLWVWIKAL